MNIIDWYVLIGSIVCLCVFVVPMLDALPIRTKETKETQTIKLTPDCFM